MLALPLRGQHGEITPLRSCVAEFGTNSMLMSVCKVRSGIETDHIFQ